MISIDGYERSEEQEHMISANVASLFETPNGKEVLKYLRSISIDMVSGANITNDALRHLEGQRYIVGIIERRIVQHHGVKRGRTDK